MITLAVVWLVFIFLFGSLCYLHWRISRKDVPHFGGMPAYGKPELRWVQSDVTAEDLDSLVKDFSNRFNSYVDVQNKLSRNSNRLQALGYLLAGTAALVSFVVTLLTICGGVPNG